MAIHNTYENNPDKRYKTHYYSNGYEECKYAVLETARNLGLSISNVDDNFREIYTVSKKYNLMIKITSVAYGETSIDLYLETKTFNIFAWKKFINIWHSELAKRLTFIGIALHP